VAILGDAAHPQTPFLGQGVNMAITDAYVYATNIAVALKSNGKILREAIADSDTDNRRVQAKGVVKEARFLNNLFTSINPFVTTLMYLFQRFAPTSVLMNEIVKTDRSNRDYLRHLDETHCSPKQQRGLRQAS